jgi:hypothetical protein
MKNAEQNSAAYEAALATVREAEAAWMEAQNLYRSRKIGDAAFFAAKVRHDAADVAFEQVCRQEVGL